MQNKKRVITYGTFDMFHIGHLNLLKRAKELGEYLVVGVTSESYDRSRGKLNVSQSLQERVKVIENLPFVDEVIIESHQGQKEEDIQKHKIDIFVLGDDWVGRFDYLEKLCKVIYLPRTKGVSSTLLRENIDTIKLGIIGTGRIAVRFIQEASHVNGVEIMSVLSHSLVRAEEFVKKHDILYGYDTIEALLDSDIDAVYIASSHETHYKHCSKALIAKKHVLCEKPVTLQQQHLQKLIELAKENNLVFLEGIKTAYTPAFVKLMEELKGGIIGDVKEVRGTFTKLVPKENAREWKRPFGGATNELMSYPLLLAIKLLGKAENVSYFPQLEDGIDSSNTIVIKHDKGKISISSAAIGSKSDGSAVISGTQGYVVIPAPWWLTKKFFVRFEDPNKQLEYNYEFEGDGLRYEISEFIACINRKESESSLLLHEEIKQINSVISEFNQSKDNV